MAFLEETRFIERLQFFNGQRLFASDLQGIEAFNREMRWLHNKSLHQPGIGSGFAVYGKKGDRKVTIGLGYAIDALGREIVLTETQTEAVPPVSAESNGKSVFYDLTVSYPEDSELEEAETREGVCMPRGVVRLREEPVFCWARLEPDDQGNLHAKSRKLKEEIKNGLKIVLARIEVLNCQLENDVSIAQRRNARLAKQPYIACGTVKPRWILPDNIVVSANEVADCPKIMKFVLTAEIPTDSADFSTTPCYSARIAGPRIRAGIKSDGQLSTDVFFIIDGLLNIGKEPQPKSFGVNVLLIVQSLGGDDQTINIQESLFSDWQIVWMGIEG
jgi:hypothetical protein